MSNKNTSPEPHKLPTIVHTIYDTQNSFTHSLTIDGEESIQVGWKDIARNGIFCAITPYYSDYFPEVFCINDFSSIAYRCKIQSGGAIKKTTKIV